MVDVRGDVLRKEDIRTGAQRHRAKKKRKNKKQDRES